MLWRVVKHARFIDHVGQMPRMPRWEPVMASGLDVQQFIERIAVRHPCCAFLVGAKKVAMTVEREADSEANTGANRLALREVRADALNRPAFHGRAIPRLARRLIYQIRFGKTRRAEAEVDAAVRSNSHAERVNALLFAAFGPRRHGDLSVGTIVAVGVHDQRQLFFRGDEHAVATCVAERRQRRANRRAQGLLFPERLDLVLQAVAVGVAEQPDASVVTDRDEFAVGATTDVVDVVQLHRQFARAEPWKMHLHRRRVGHGHEWQLPLARRGGVQPVEQRAILCVEITIDGGAITFGQHPVEDEHFSEVTGEEVLRVRTVRRVRIMPGAESEFVQAHQAGGALACALRLSIQEELHSTRAGTDDQREDVPAGHWLRCGEQVCLAGKTHPLGVHARKARVRRAAEIEIQTGSVIVAAGQVERQQRAITSDLLRRGDNENRDIRERGVQPGGAEKIVRAVERKERAVELLAKPWPRFEQGLTEMAAISGAVEQIVRRVAPGPQGRQLTRAARGVLARDVEPDD